MYYFAQFIRLLAIHQYLDLYFSTLDSSGALYHKLSLENSQFGPRFAAC